MAVSSRAAAGIGCVLLAALVAGPGCDRRSDESGRDLGAADAPLPPPPVPRPAAAPRAPARAPAAPPAAAPRPAAPARAEATLEQALVPFEPLALDIEPNARVAAIDLDEDGRDELVLASFGKLAVLRATGEEIWSAEAPGGATAIATGDLDGDGRDDVAVGWGMHRERRDAPARLHVYRTLGAAPGTLREETVAVPRTTRAQFGSLQVTALEPGGPAGVLFTHFVSKYDLRGAFARPEGAARWRQQELYQMRMGSLLVSAPGAGATPRLVVGRSYGDQTRAPGDVFVRAPDGGRSLLPSLRGVRSLAAVALGPGSEPLPLLCYGDGWHWRYRDEGEGRLTCVREQPDEGFAAQLVAVTDSYSLEHLAPADLDGDGALELVAQGSEGIYRFSVLGSSETGPAWQATKLGPGGRHFAVADTDGDGRDELFVIGDAVGWIRLP